MPLFWNFHYNTTFLLFLFVSVKVEEQRQHILCNLIVERKKKYYFKMVLNDSLIIKLVTNNKNKHMILTHNFGMFPILDLYFLFLCLS